MSEDKDDIDWSLTTWEGSRRAQLRYALTLTLRERLEAVEGMAEVARRFQWMRAEGKLRRRTIITNRDQGRRPETLGNSKSIEIKGVLK